MIGAANATVEIWRSDPLVALGASDGAPTAARAAVGVFVCPAPREAPVAAGSAVHAREGAVEHAVTLDTAVRAQLVADLVAALQAGITGSRVRLRGSLAIGTADRYSDIDLLWEVPDAAFSDAIDKVSTICAGVRPVASLRSDPDFQHSLRRRLLFIRFREVPLFWRVDLDILARSVARDPDYDRDNPAACGGEWSATESSLMNAVAALKAHLRGRDDEAARLLGLGEARVGAASPAIAIPERILVLADAVVRGDPALTQVAADVRQLVVGQ